MQERNTLQDWLEQFELQKGSFEELSQMAEVSISHIRSIINRKSSASRAVQTRIISSIIELEGHKKKVLTREEFKRLYFERRKEVNTNGKTQL